MTSMSHQEGTHLKGRLVKQDGGNCATGAPPEKGEERRDKITEVVVFVCGTRASIRIVSLLSQGQAFFFFFFLFFSFFVCLLAPIFPFPGEGQDTTRDILQVPKIANRMHSFFASTAQVALL